MNIVALIPARSGSRRIVDKNIKPLKGIPLIGYTIDLALRAKVFSRVVCATDSFKYAEIAKTFGAHVPAIRPAELSSYDSPDIDWVVWLDSILKEPLDQTVYCILRPTSPFRDVPYIEDALRLYSTGLYSSVRGISLASQHPGKMWRFSNPNEHNITPLMPFSNTDLVPWHSCQSSILPPVFIQNASIEFFSKKTLLDTQSISGTVVGGYVCNDWRAFDINEPADWDFAEYLISSGKVCTT